MKKNNNILPLIINTIILIILFAIILFALNKRGYLSFNKTIKPTTTDQSEIVPTNDDVSKKQDDTNTKNENNHSNMTAEQVFDLWKKIKGNWGHVNYDGDHDMCSGTSIEINTNIKIAKFNSDGITTWNIIFFEKISDNKYKINLILPVNLNNEMNGDIKANNSSIIVDTSKINDKKLIVELYGSNIEFDYVSENKIIVNEETHYQYIDGGLKQDDYCTWYKNNH